MRSKLNRMLVAILLIALLGCGMPEPADPDTPEKEASVKSLSVSKSVLDPGDVCSNGGIQVEIGVDSNGNGTIDTNEIERVEYVCNGENGIDSIVQSIEELPGDNCSEGGVKLNIGYDLNLNTTLDTEEIDKTVYICDGVAAVNSLILISNEDPGDNCFDGGKKIETGLDIDKNKILDSTEVTETTYLCYLSSMITMTSDRDKDGLTDIYEITHNLDPENPDIDDDGTSDGDEVTNGTDPLNPDTEIPVLNEFSEVSRFSTDEP